MASPRGGDTLPDMPDNHIVLVSMPKSATVFITRSLQLSAGLEEIQICNSGPLVQQISPQGLWRFANAPSAIGGQHMPASDYNIEMLRQAGIERVTLLLRDPRDAVISWWHHLYRPDVRSFGWHHAMLVAARTSPDNFYELAPENALDTLIEMYLPRLLSWQNQWEAETRVSKQIIRYEDFVTNKTETISKILGFHGISAGKIEFPEIDQSDSIDSTTHFRRGEIGSYLDEMSTAQIERTNQILEDVI
ncbi:MAG: sulfotransferase domain-containing protein [Alphaproteobacteria bacterium]